MEAQHCPLGLHALWGLCAAGVVGRRRSLGACHRCEGRLASLGAVPPPVARPLGRAAWVPRPVCPGCGRCGRCQPPSARPCELAWPTVGVAEGRTRGVCLYRWEWRLRPGAPPLPAARPSGGLSGSVTHVLWARVCGRGGPALSPWLACPVGAACRGVGGGPPPGGLACHRCEGRLESGAVPPLGRPPSGAGSRGSAIGVSPVQLVRARGPCTGLTACALVG